MERERALEILNNILAWGAEHNDDFMYCLVHAAQLTPEEAKELNVEEYLLF